MNSIRNSMQRSEDFLTDQGPAEHVSDTGFVDNWQAALGQFIDEDLSISRYIHEGRPTISRDRELEEMREAGAFPENMFPRQSSYPELAEYAKNILGKDIRTDEDINKDVRAELTQRREYASGVFDNANLAGKTGRLAGTFHGAMLDPVTWPGMTVGVGAAANATSALRAIGIASGINAGVAAVEEVPIQMAVHSWKKDIGQKFTVGDALANISLAAGGAGTLGALGESLKQAIKVINKTPNVPPEVKQAVEYMSREIDEAPDVEADAVKYFDDIETEANKINEGKPHGGNDKDPFNELDDDALEAEFNTLFEDSPTMYRGQVAGVEPHQEGVLWFTPSEKGASTYAAQEGGSVISAKLDLKKTASVDDMIEIATKKGLIKEDGTGWSGPDLLEVPGVLDELKANGYDSLHIKEDYGLEAPDVGFESVASFSSAQVKRTAKSLKDELATEGLDSARRVEVEAELAGMAYTPGADMMIPTKYTTDIDGLRVAETKPLREALKDFDLEEEKLLTLKACIGG